VSVLVWRVANKVQEIQLQKKMVNRSLNQCAKRVADLEALGYKKFESASLAAFNKKIEAMKEGNLTFTELDDIAPLNLSTETPEEDGDNDFSVLHDEEEYTKVI
jgi:hypothetical protein